MIKFTKLLSLFCFTLLESCLACSFLLSIQIILRPYGLIAIFLMTAIIILLSSILFFTDPLLDVCHIFIWAYFWFSVYYLTVQRCTSASYIWSVYMRDVRSPTYSKPVSLINWAELIAHLLLLCLPLSLPTTNSPTHPFGRHQI